MSVFFCPPDLTKLIEASSIAIWNKNMFIVGIAIIVWATNIGVIALGKLVPLPLLTNVQGRI
jgi:hypothetical protein